jgi:hypothetical protein
VPTYPYVSGQAPLVGAFAQLRKGVPPKVDAGYLQRFNIAPGNESYVISILRFLGVIDEEGNRLEGGVNYLYGSDESFRSGLEDALRSAYSQVFDEMGEGALEADRANLTHWFRAADKTSDLVGQRQASTFLTLAALAGHGELQARSNAKRTAPAASSAVKKAATKKATAKKATASSPAGVEAVTIAGASPGGQAVRAESSGGAPIVHDVGLTVRIEINLPPGGDADTYDAIFASLKKHLMS